MKKLVGLACMVLFFTSLSFSQDYKTAIGIKGGFPGIGAVNLKHNMGANAIDVSVGGGSRHLWIQGLYEWNNPIQDGFSWYYGLGADLGFYNEHYGWRDNKYYDGRVTLGLDGVIGIEYTFPTVPINLALEAVPTIRLTPYTGFYMYGNFAVRFAIK